MGIRFTSNWIKQAYINVSLYAKGNQGQFTIGQMHLRRAMADESVMIPGGGRIRDDEASGRRSDLLL